MIVIRRPGTPNKLEGNFTTVVSVANDKQLKIMYPTEAQIFSMQVINIFYEMSVHKFLICLILASVVRLLKLFK